MTRSVLIALVFAVLPLVSAVVLLHRQRAKFAEGAPEIGAISLIAGAQRHFREEDVDGDGVKNFAPDLAALAKARLIDPELASGRRFGYAFRMVVPTGTARLERFFATADPLEETKEAPRRHLYVDERGWVRMEIGRPAGPESGVIGR